MRTSVIVALVLAAFGASSVAAEAQATEPGSSFMFTAQARKRPDKGPKKKKKEKAPKRASGGTARPAKKAASDPKVGARKRPGADGGKAGAPQRSGAKPGTQPAATPQKGAPKRPGK